MYCLFLFINQDLGSLCKGFDTKHFIDQSQDYYGDHPQIIPGKHDHKMKCWKMEIAPLLIQLEQFHLHPHKNTQAETNKKYKKYML